MDKVRPDMVLRRGETHYAQYANYWHTVLSKDEEGLVELGPPLCPGVICKCAESGAFCPMHGRRR